MARGRRVWPSGLREQMKVAARVGAAVVAERQVAAVVGVADLRRQAIGARVSGHEREHRVKTLTIRARRRVRREHRRRLDPAHGQLSHQPVIRDRGLVVAAVGPDLVAELSGDLGDGEPRPAPPLAPAAEQRRDREQPDHVGQVVISPNGRPLEMASDEPPMQQQARDDRLEPALARRRVRHQRERATQFAVLIATSIVHAQLGPNSTGF